MAVDNYSSVAKCQSLLFKTGACEQEKKGLLLFPRSPHQHTTPEWLSFKQFSVEGDEILPL